MQPLDLDNTKAAEAAQDNTEPSQQPPPEALEHDHSHPHNSVDMEGPMVSSHGLTDKVNPQDESQVSANSEINKAPASNFEGVDVASSSEANPTGSSKTVRIGNRVAQLKVLLHEEQDADEYSPHIRSEGELQEFEEAMELLNADDQGSSRAAGYPDTEDGFSDHCHILFVAMKNLVDVDEVVAVATDDAELSGSDSKDSVAVKFIKTKKGIEVTIVAAKLMRAMRKAQLGQLLLVGKRNHISKYDNFTLRFQAVVDALKSSKLLVRSAFEGDEWVTRIAANPAAELKRKRTNKTINDEKTQKQKYAAEMKKRDPSVDFKDTSKTPDARELGTSAAAPASAAAQTQQSSESPAGPSGQPREESETELGERPSKRAKTSEEPQEESANVQDGTLALDPDPMNVPGPFQSYGFEYYRGLDDGEESD